MRDQKRSCSGEGEVGKGCCWGGWVKSVSEEEVTVCSRLKSFYFLIAGKCWQSVSKWDKAPPHRTQKTGKDREKWLFATREILTLVQYFIYLIKNFTSQPVIYLIVSLAFKSWVISPAPRLVITQGNVMTLVGDASLGITVWIWNVPIDSCFYMLGFYLMVLFWQGMEPLGVGVLLEEIGHFRAGLLGLCWPHTLPVQYEERSLSHRLPPPSCLPHPFASFK